MKLFETKYRIILLQYGHTFYSPQSRAWWAWWWSDLSPIYNNFHTMEAAKEAIKEHKGFNP